MQDIIKELVSLISSSSSLSPTLLSQLTSLNLPLPTPLQPPSQLHHHNPNNNNPNNNNNPMDYESESK